MSLESQIGSLVEAANSLTGTVAGKMQEIDQKVDQATSAVPGLIKNMSEAWLYIDSENGDDNAEGTRATPLRTLSEAGNRYVPGTSLIVYLRHGQTFHVGSTTVFRAPIGAVSIRTASGFGDEAAGRPKLVLTLGEGMSNTANRGRIFRIESGAINITDTDITARDADNELETSRWDGVFYVQSTNTYIEVINSKIRLEGVNLCGRSRDGRSILPMVLHNVEFEHIGPGYGGIDTPMIFDSDGALMMFGASNASLPDGYEWSDLLPITESGRNILTNLNLPEHSE